MSGKSSMYYAAAAAMAALALSVPAASAQPAASAAVRVSCPITGGETSGLRNIAATFTNRSVTVTATVVDDQSGSTRAHFRAIQGRNVVDEELSSWVDEERRSVTVQMSADRPGGVSKVEYWTESSTALTDSTHRFCAR
ncbi:hypothetical protein ABZ464_07620 [Streptomyces sp. NPDC005820]|uniref:hypothetical protein n=1 Tax=Streptomyces sp. NPDC005820 TaxID=3157069 RepID=UPI0033D2187F